MKKWHLSRVVVAVFLGGISACATVGGGSPGDAVRERAQARWDDLVRGDYQAAYRFLSPGSRQVRSEKDYVNSLRPGFWKSAKVDKVECEAARCEVEAMIEYEFQGRRTKTPLRETWIHEGSDWWYVLR